MLNQDDSEAIRNKIGSPDHPISASKVRLAFILGILDVKLRSLTNWRSFNPFAATTYYILQFALRLVPKYHTKQIGTWHDLEWQVRANRGGLFHKMSHKMTRGQGGRQTRTADHEKKTTLCQTMQADVERLESTLCRKTQTKAGLLQVREALTKESLSLFICVFPLMKCRKWPKNVCMGQLWWSICTTYHHISPHARIAARGKTENAHMCSLCRSREPHDFVRTMMKQTFMPSFLQVWKVNLWLKNL